MHLHPVRAKLLKPEAALESYRWSSYPEYLKHPSPRGPWLRGDRVLGELGIQRDDAGGRRRFAGALAERRGKDAPGQWKVVRRGWFLGAQPLQEALLEQMGAEMGAHHDGEEQQESEEQKAEGLVRKELHRCGWRRRNWGNAARLTHP